MTKEEIEKLTINLFKENQITISNSLFYDFCFNKESFISYLTNGIQCRKLLNLPTTTYEGQYYISLLKPTFNFELGENSSLFIINRHILTFLPKEVTSFTEKFVDTPLPIRCSDNIYEYQAFYRIKPNKIIGIHYDLTRIVDLTRLKELKLLVETLKSIDKDIPIYDLYIDREIDKEKVLELIK